MDAWLIDELRKQEEARRSADDNARRLPLYEYEDDRPARPEPDAERGVIVLQF